MNGWQDPGARRDVLLAVAALRRTRDTYRRMADEAYHMSTLREYEARADQWDSAAHQLFRRGRTSAA